MIPPAAPAAVNTGMNGVFRNAGWLMQAVITVPNGSFGARYRTKDRRLATVFVSEFIYDGQVHSWLHASISIHGGAMPTYEDMALLHRAVYGRRRYSYQVFAPEAKHVNITENVLHLFGRVDGANALPDFAPLGTI